MEAALLQGFASSLLETLISRVANGFLVELKKMKDVDKAVEKLETTISTVPVLLQKLDTSQFKGNETFIQVLRKRIHTLTTICYDVEDVLDEITLMIAKRNSESRSIQRPRDVIWRYIRTWTIAYSISKLQEKLTGILEQLEVLTNTIPDVSCELNLEMPSIEMDTSVKKKLLFGRDNELKEIIETLISCPSNGGVSIVGMFGLGKTSLAEKIMSDARMVEEFPIILRVPVWNGCLNKKETLDRLAEELSSRNLILKQRTKLIVFDNLLEVKLSDWDDVFCAFKDTGETKFLITTHNSEIPRLTGTTPHHLKLLPNEFCEKLIMEKARLHSPTLSEPSFTLTAGVLARKCEGLPLVARMIGLVLAKCDKDEWKTLCNADLWEWPAFEDEIRPALLSSYKDIQSECFAFLSLFPCNYNFYVDELVQLWVGAGFIQQLENSSSLKDSDTPINHLLRRSIVQQCDDNVMHIERPRFVLHKLYHRSAQLAASKTCFRLDDEGASILYSDNNDIRHLSLVCECENIQSTVWTQMKELKRLCTILSLCANNRVCRLGRIPPHLFKKIERLRILGLSNTDVAEVPDSIDKLKHLRYLDVSHTPVSKLPETLCNIHSLQILKFANTSFSHLPKQLCKLTKLLFLDWDISMLRRLGLPRYIGNLSKLHNLPLFEVGQREGCSITELKAINALEGSIRIKNLENVRDRKEAEEAMLYKKESLKRVELEWNSSRNDSISRDVLEGLQPHDSLKELKITRYGCHEFPQWIGNQPHWLQKIHLHKCHSCNMLPPLGRLGCLKILVLEDMSSLQSADTSLRGSPTNDTVVLFPSLEVLEFTDMPELQSWRGLEAGSMLRLRELKLVKCPKMVDLPSLQNLTSLVDVHIDCCQALESLSELPTSLKSLVIRDSPLLKDQFQVGGNQWYKMDSILNVEIDYKVILTSGVSLSSCRTT